MVPLREHETLWQYLKSRRVPSSFMAWEMGRMPFLIAWTDWIFPSMPSLPAMNLSGGRFSGVSRLDLRQGSRGLSGRHRAHCLC